MKFLERIRSRSKSRYEEDNARSAGRGQPLTGPAAGKLNAIANFPHELLDHILGYVCPHSQDDSFTSCEESMADGGCMLCDMNDLAQCCLINRQWHRPAQGLLYCHVRIDAVHYCNRDLKRSGRRRTAQRRSWGGRHQEQKDDPRERVVLFSKTVRERGHLASRVLSLKTPYMARESCIADLARIVSVLPNLQYLDLPDGFYDCSPSTEILRQELQAKCPDMRWMKYTGGAESSLRALSDVRLWQNLEYLCLQGLCGDQSTLMQTLSSLPKLKAVDLCALPSLDDQTIISLPPLSSMSIRESPNVSLEGITSYLSQDMVPETLTSLTLSHTGVLASNLNPILDKAYSLTHLSIHESISRPFPISPPPPLSSSSLKTLEYAITASIPGRPHALPSQTQSYYAYLADSLQSGTLPSLTEVYALSTSLLELLRKSVPSPTLPSLPLPSGGTKSSPPLDSSGPPQYLPLSTSPLKIFTKSLEELEWNLTLFKPLPIPPIPSDNDASYTKNTPGAKMNNSDNKNRFSTASLLSTTRPVSLYDAPQLSAQYRNTGQESVMVGNGFGGFLTVPSGREVSGGGGDMGRGPLLKSPKSPKKSMLGREKDQDAWMG